MVGPGAGVYLVCLKKVRQRVWLKWLKPGTENHKMRSEAKGSRNR